MAKNRKDKCVHTEHCCAIHGCKYGHDDCPVATMQKAQSFPCEDCREDSESIYTAGKSKVPKHNYDRVFCGYEDVSMLVVIPDTHRVVPVELLHDIETDLIMEITNIGRLQAIRAIIEDKP